MKIPYFLDSFLHKKFSMIYAEWNRTIYDKNNKIIKSKKQVAYSTLEQFVAILYANITNATDSALYSQTAPYVSARCAFSTSSTLCTFNNGTIAMSCVGTAGASNDGIVLGSDSGVLAPNNRSLTTLITHGSGAGQLSYGAQGCFNGLQTSGNVVTLTLYRNFINNSGAAIKVKEIGLYSNMLTGNFCIVRDLIASPFDVIGTLQNYAVTLTFQFTT